MSFYTKEKILLEFKVPLTSLEIGKEKGKWTL